MYTQKHSRTVACSPSCSSRRRRCQLRRPRSPSNRPWQSSSSGWSSWAVRRGEATFLNVGVDGAVKGFGQYGKRSQFNKWRPRCPRGTHTRVTSPPPPFPPSPFRRKEGGSWASPPFVPPASQTHMSKQRKHEVVWTQSAPSSHPGQRLGTTSTAVQPLRWCRRLDGDGHGTLPATERTQQPDETYFAESGASVPSLI